MESGSNKVKSTYSPRKILSSRFLSRGRWRPKGVAAPCLRGEGVNVMGGGGLEKGLVDGHERLFIACSRDRRTVSCMAAIWASVNGPGCESVGALCGADSPNEARSTSSSSKPSTEPTDEDFVTGIVGNPVGVRGIGATETRCSCFCAPRCTFWHASGGWRLGWARLDCCL